MAEHTEEETTSLAPKVSAAKMQPTWKKAPEVTDFKADHDSAESGQDAFRERLEGWKETREGGKAITVNALGKSTSRPLVVRKSNEWKYPALEEPFLSTTSLFKISPATYKDVEAAKQNESILNYQWNTKVQKTKFVTDVIRTVVDEGTVIVKTGWKTEFDIEEVEEEQPVYATPAESLVMMQEAVQSGNMAPEQAQAMMETGEPIVKGTKLVKVEKEVMVINQPTYEVCLNANVTIDPTCDGVMEDALFVIHEYDTNLAELRMNEFETLEDGSTRGFYYNLDHIGTGETVSDDDALTDESNEFKFADKARKRLRAYEYWGYWDVQDDGVLVGVVATWVDNVLIRLQENPFPHARLPFSVSTYMPVKKSVHGEPDAEILKENQDTIGRMTRAIQDITTKQAVGQEFIDENFFPSPSQKNSYEKGNTVFYRTGFDPKKAIHRSDIQQVGSTPFDVINWQTTDANELTGTRPFSGPGGAKMNGNQQSKDSMDATAKRELSILRRLSDNLFVDMAKMTIAMNQAFLPEETVVRITDKEFVTINRDDLGGDFDLRVQVSTPERDQDQAEKLMKLMQTNAANMDQEIVKMHYVKMAELWKMEDLAMAVSEYQPQPDPKQEQLMELQLEEQKLKNAILMKELEDLDSKITERVSRAAGNTNDSDLTAAKTEQALALADKLKSETDILDQSFLYLQSGKSRQEDIEDQEYTTSVDAAKSADDRKASIEDQEYAATVKAFETAGHRASVKTVNEV